MRMASIIRSLVAVSLCFTTISVHAESPAVPRSNQRVLSRFAVGRDGDFLVLPISLNGKSGLNFLVSLSSPITVVDQRHRGLLGEHLLSFEVEQGTSTAPAELIEGGRVRIGELPEVVLRDVISMDTSGFRSETDYDVDGLIGLDLLKDAIVRIDFVLGQIDFLSQVPADPGERVNVVFARNGVPMVSCEIGKMERADVPLSTYFTGGLAVAGTLFTRLAARGEAVPLWAENQEFPPDGRSVRVGQLNDLKVGSFSQHNVAVGILQTNAIGLGWLSQFLVTIDFPGKAMYLRATTRFPNNNVRNLGGVGFRRHSGGIVVSVVDPSGPGAAAGLMIGDEILSMNGVQPPNLTLFRISSLLAQPRSRVDFTVLRGAKKMNAVVDIPDSSAKEVGASLKCDD